MDNTGLSPPSPPTKGLFICRSLSWETSSLAVPAGGVLGGSHPQPQPLVPSPCPSLTSRSQWAPGQSGPLTWLFFPDASGLDGGHALALEDREHESCCHQITYGGC